MCSQTLLVLLRNNTPSTRVTFLPYQSFCRVVQKYRGKSMLNIIHVMCGALFMCLSVVLIFKIFSNVHFGILHFNIGFPVYSNIHSCITYAPSKNLGKNALQMLHLFNSLFASIYVINIHACGHQGKLVFVKCK